MTMSLIHDVPSRRAHAATAIAATDQLPAGRRSETLGAFAEPVADLVAWIHDNRSERLTVADLARRTAMSPRSLSRRFQREVGTTPARYIESVRLQVAQSLLSSRSDSLEENAEARGLTSAEILRRLSKRRLNIAPSRYRQALKNFHFAARAEQLSMQASPVPFRERRKARDSPHADSQSTSIK